MDVTSETNLADWFVSLFTLFSPKANTGRLRLKVVFKWGHTTRSVTQSCRRVLYSPTGTNTKMASVGRRARGRRAETEVLLAAVGHSRVEICSFGTLELTQFIILGLF